MIFYKHCTKSYYRDVDKMGIVYYSRYFEYFEEARTELLGNIGLNISQIEKKGIELPVISAHCDYKKSAFINQDLTVETYIKELPKTRLKIEYEVYNNKSKEVLVLGYTIHVFIKSNGRPTKIPDFILNKINQYF